MNFFLAIDIGASSGRHILGCIEGSKLRLEEIYRFKNTAVEQDGQLVWDVDRLFREVIAGMKRAKELGKVPASIGIDTWAVDYALLGKDMERIGSVFAYRSERTAPVINRVHSCIPFETLYARTGIQFQTFNTVYQLAADAVSGRLAKAEYMLMLPDYLHYLLTGRLSREYTNATSTGLVNARRRDWDRELVHALGLPAKLFTPLSQPGTSLGGLSEEVREAVGYDAQVVLPATHDTASAVVASLAGDGAYLSSGTWSLLGSVQKEPHTGSKCRMYNYSNEGHPGGKVRLQKNIMGLWLVQQLREEEGASLSWSQLAELAREGENDAEIDVNDPAFFAPRSMKEAVERAAGRNFTLGEAAYAVYRGLALCYKKALIELSAVTGERYRSLNIFGGGSQNALLNELTAREAGVKVVAGPTEATAIGNLIVQMAAAGETSLDGAAQLISRSFETEEYGA